LIKTFLSRSIPSSKPSDKSNFDSKIITYQHAELILKWINKLEITDKLLTTSCKFKLLFRGSRDGLTTGKFHEFCDSQSHTVTIAKVKDSNEILGGYNPLEWKSDRPPGSWVATKDSFIFSFKNNDRTEDHILSRVMKEKKAILNYIVHGPIFGGDLCIFLRNSSKCGCTKGSYEKQIRETQDEFFVEECEVFQVVQD
jgi:hypothetical protein